MKICKKYICIFICKMNLKIYSVLFNFFWSASFEHLIKHILLQIKQCTAVCHWDDKIAFYFVFVMVYYSPSILLSCSSRTYIVNWQELQFFHLLSKSELMNLIPVYHEVKGLLLEILKFYRTVQFQHYKT